MNKQTEMSFFLTPAGTEFNDIVIITTTQQSFRRRRMERPAGSRHSCAVTRGLQIAPQDISVLALIL